MLVSMKAPSFPFAPKGDGEIFHAFITIGMNTTHTAVRGT